MRKKSTIQKLLAFVMLLIFSFSITPKKFLHDSLSDHKDYFGTATKSGDKAGISIADFNCHFNNLVVSSPFFDDSFEISLGSSITYKTLLIPPYHFHFLKTHIAKDLRGPPGLA